MMKRLWRKKRRKKRKARSCRRPTRTGLGSLGSVASGGTSSFVKSTKTTSRYVMIVVRVVLPFSCACGWVSVRSTFPLTTLFQSNSIYSHFICCRPPLLLFLRVLLPLLQDDFNLTGLNGVVPYYDYALDMVLDVEMPMEDSLTDVSVGLWIFIATLIDTNRNQMQTYWWSCFSLSLSPFLPTLLPSLTVQEQQEIVESAAEMLYGLIHARCVHASCLAVDLVVIGSHRWYTLLFVLLKAISHHSNTRVLTNDLVYLSSFQFVLACVFVLPSFFFLCRRYIVTSRGMHAMYEKYRTASFGRCPHVFCQGQPVLPVGLSDLPRNYTVNVFCPRCHGLFFPKSTRQANIDGAYFGTTFPHLYLMTHPDMVPARPSQQYIPRVFGFKIHQSSLYYRNHIEGPSMEHSHRSSRKSKHRQSRK